MNTQAELSFKSIDNSINKDDKDWAILSMKITKNKSKVDLGCKYCLYRKIAYLDKTNKTYQTGSLYVPLNNIRCITFFLRLIFSGKTFGHFVSLKYPKMYHLELISTTVLENQNNLLFKNFSRIKVSERVLFMPKKKLKFYVKEELEID